MPECAERYEVDEYGPDEKREEKDDEADCGN
jgi:hypothetical protein